MARKFSESDFTPSAPRKFSDADFAEPSRQAADSGEALLTNLPAKGFGQSLVRSLPATVGGIIGGAAGAPLGPLGIAAGAGIGAEAGEAVRQGVSQLTATMFPQEKYPIQSPGQVLMDVGTAGVSNMVPNLLFPAAGAAYRALRPGAVRAGAAGMKVAANVPEGSGAYAIDDLSRLSRAPSQEAVETGYDAFHKASGTMSRKESIARSDDPFDTVSRAMKTMREAHNKLRTRELTHQDAVEASQAARIIRDMKSRGVEMAQEVSEQADAIKGQMDNFIERGLRPRWGTEKYPIASEIIPQARSEVVAQQLNPIPHNFPTQESVDLMPRLKTVVEAVRRAKAEGVHPKTVLTESERALYDTYRSPIESAAEFRVPLETLLSPADAAQAVPGFVEGVRYGPGQMVRKTTPGYREGVTFLGEREVLRAPEVPGFPEWQNARQLAFERNVADDFSSALPRNVSGQPNVLRTVTAGHGGMAAGAALGAAMGGLPGAVIGGGIGAAGGLASVSPMVYGGAIRAAGAVSRAAGKIPAGTYRLAPAAAGATTSSLADQYMRLRPAQ